MGIVDKLFSSNPFSSSRGDIVGAAGDVTAQSTRLASIAKRQAEIAEFYKTIDATRGKSGSGILSSFSASGATTTPAAPAKASQSFKSPSSLGILDSTTGKKSILGN